MNTETLLVWIIHFLLIAARMSSMFILSPILGRAAIPSMAKIGLSLMCALMLINLYPAVIADYPYTDVIALAGAMVRELTVGLVMGFGTVLFFNIVYTAGHIIDVQIGFSMSQQFDPASNSQVAVSGSLLNVIFIECFLLADGIPKLMNLLGQTMEVIPVGTAAPAIGIAQVALSSFVKSFILSLNVAMPVLASALLCEIGLGIVVRTAPQMNVFVIGIPIKIIVGLLMLVLTVPVFVAFTGILFERMFEAADELLYMLIPAG